MKYQALWLDSAPVTQLILELKQPAVNDVVIKRTCIREPISICRPNKHFSAPEKGVLKQPPNPISQSSNHIPETLTSKSQTVSAAALFITMLRLFLQINDYPQPCLCGDEMKKLRRKVHRRALLPICSNMTCSSIGVLRTNVWIEGLHVQRVVTF